MDDFKDVMLSDLPSGPLPVNYGTQQSMKHKQNVPQRSMALLDNYKGILLCDRPSDVKMQNVNPVPFLPAGPMENQMLGLQPSAEQRMSREIMRTMHSKCSKTTPGSTALLRHRKFLTQLNNTIRAKHEQATENLLRDAEKRTRFMSAQAIARLKSMNRVHSKDQPVNEQVENTARVLEKIPAEQNSIEQWTGEVVTSKSDTAQDPLTTEKDITCSKVPRKGSKPTWAMTAEEAEDYEQQEVEQLLRFAEGLDFTQFLNDLEVRDAFTRVRSRVEELMNGGINSNRVAPPSFRSTLVESKRCDIPTDKKDPDVGARSHVAEHQKPWDRSTAIPACDRMKREAVSTELLCLAEKILSKSEELREVYSKLALARLLQESLTSAMEQKGDGIAWLQSVVPHLAKASISSAAKKKVLPLEELAQPPPFLPPTIQSISACANSPHEAALLAMKDSSNAGMHAQRRILVDLKKSTDYVQNLPYLYRCPSI